MAVLRTTALFCAGLAAATLLVEAGARLVELTPLWRVLPVAEVALYSPDPHAGYDLRPNVTGIWAAENHASVAINALGLRDGPMTREKPAGTRRVLVLGDSVTEALQVELDQTFVQVAERALQDKGMKVEVVNLGLSGASPAVSVQRLRHKGLALSPDAALVTANVDELALPAPEPDSAFANYVADGHGNARIGTAFRDTRGFQLRSGPVGAALYWALDHLRVARILNARKNVGVLQEWPSAASSSATACAERASALVEALRDGAPGFALARVRAFAADLGASARQAGMPVTVLLRGMAPVCGDDPAVLAGVRDRLAALLAAEGVTLVDMDAEVARRLPAGVTARDLRGFGNRRGQGHLNPLGHQVYAQVVEQVATGMLGPAR